MINTYDFEICPPGLSVQAMRNSGYKDAAYAISELIDNSLQAGLSVKKSLVTIEVLCLVVEEYNQRSIKKINEIAVYDNASGMDPETMRIALQFGNGTHLDTDQGIGKFGMGLPNSSISQCKRVDIYSWQNKKCFHTYLDIDEIISGEMRVVPAAEKSDLPKKWKQIISSKLEDSGTLIIWSKLDQLKWRTHSALFDNSEFLIGRIYRYFLSSNKVKIYFAAYLKNSSGFDRIYEKLVKPNDPLYLMEKTCAPEPFNNKPAFIQFSTEPISAKIKGKKSEIKIIFSICEPEIKKIGGATAIGKHMAKNVGISLVRAQRELEMDTSFINRYNTNERWWGCEVQFDPIMDDVFGVTNTKQAAAAFYRMSADEDAKAEGMTTAAFLDHLNDLEDPRVIIYEVSRVIDKHLATIRNRIDIIGFGTRSKDKAISNDKVEDVSTEAVKRRRQTLGTKGESDIHENDPESKRKKELADTLVEFINKPREEAILLAGQIIKRKTKVIFEKAELSGSAFFDIKKPAGVLVIVININHPASKHLFQLLEKEPEDKNKQEALQALKLILGAWAILEDEASIEERQRYEDARFDWGRVTRDFIKVFEEWD